MAGEVARREPGTPARTDQAPSRFGRDKPKTIYANITDAGSSRTSSGPSTEEYVYDNQGGGFLSRFPNVRGKVPKGVPSFLGDSRIIAYSWLTSMIMVGFDEWHNNSILPRPARLWYTSAVYGVLAILAQVPVLTAVCNALAIGYTIMLIWQYFNKTGQFAS